MPTSDSNAFGAFTRSEAVIARELGGGEPELQRKSAAAEGCAAPFSPLASLNYWIDVVAPVPWTAHSGCRKLHRYAHLRETLAGASEKAPLYTAEERRRRDQSPWTTVQAVLAPIQFLVFLISAGLVVQFLATGQGYAIATASVVLKTAILYAIMVTGSIWEKDVFGKWLFARPFFWEDVVSMLVLALHTAYLAAVFLKLGTPDQQMWLALAAYGTYVVNAVQFLLKLRAARLEGAPAGRTDELPSGGARV